MGINLFIKLPKMTPKATVVTKTIFFAILLKCLKLTENLFDVFLKMKLR